MSKTLFVELGVGSDQHGQDGTKAAVRACKDAISFNSLPAIADLIPGGYGGMSGIAIEAMGDRFDGGKANDDFIVVNAAVSVGY